MNTAHRKDYSFGRRIGERWDDP